MFGFGKKKAAEEEGATPKHRPRHLADPSDPQPTPSVKAKWSVSGDIAQDVADSGSRKSSEFSREYGPYDSSEQSTDESYLDFGSLKVKMIDGLNMRLDVDQKTQQMVAVTLTKGNASLQVQAFAAPKSYGIWFDIADEIAQSVRQQGGTAEFLMGPLGRQMISKLPAKTADGRNGYRVARFVGVDGPRWFLRGVFSGDAALKVEAAAEMEEVFRSIVVDRGEDPRPPRDILPMTVPESILEAQEEQKRAAQKSVEEKKTSRPITSRPMPRRGPEITEIR